MYDEHVVFESRELVPPPPECKYCNMANVTEQELESHCTKAAANERLLVQKYSGRNLDTCGLCRNVIPHDFTG